MITLSQPTKFHKNPPVSFRVITLTNTQTNKQTDKRTQVKSITSLFGQVITPYVSTPAETEMIMVCYFGYILRISLITDLWPWSKEYISRKMTHYGWVYHQRGLDGTAGNRYC